MFTNRNVSLASIMILSGAAVLLPPRWIAGVLTGHDAARMAVVAPGAWLLKASLVALAAWVAVTAHLLAAPARRSPLIELPDPDSHLGGRRATLILAAVLALALTLRVIGLSAGLWFDEIQTLVDYARLPLGQLLTTFDSQNNHLLYSLSASMSLGVFGESAASLRAPAMIFGVASIWALYRLGSLVAPREQALLAVALAAVSYHHVWFSQNARGYTALLFFTLLGTRYFLELLSREPSWRLILGYGLAMALASYTHITAALTVIAHGGIWLALVWHRRRNDWQAPLSALALAALASITLYSLVLPQLGNTLLSSTHGGRMTDWQSPVWFMVETVRGLSRGLPGGWIAGMVGAVILLAGTWSYWRQSRVVVLCMVVPPVLTAGMALALSHNLWPRFFFFAAGFALLIVVRGIYTMALPVGQRSGLVAAIVAVAVVVGSSFTVPRAWHPKQDYGGAAAFVDEKRGIDDAVVTIDLTTMPVTEYLARPWQNVVDASSLGGIEASHPRTWVMVTFPVRLEAVFPDIDRRLAMAYDTAAVFPGTVGGGTIFVLVSQ